MVGDQDEGALRVSRVEAARGVGEHKSFDAEFAQDAGTKGDLLRGVAFIKMNASAHDGDGHARDVADN